MGAVCRLYMVWTVCEWVLYAGCTWCGLCVNGCCMQVVHGVDCV